nr:probable ATP-dependent DNA helicase CHR12 [Tanacetum cinerariifolium]
MLKATTDGLHAKTNGAAFEMEMEGIVSTCDVSDLPELNCPLCKQVMKDAAYTKPDNPMDMRGKGFDYETANLSGKRRRKE